MFVVRAGRQTLATKQPETANTKKYATVWPYPEKSLGRPFMIVSGPPPVLPVIILLAEPEAVEVGTDAGPLGLPTSQQDASTEVELEEACRESEEEALQREQADLQRALVIAGHDDDLVNLNDWGGERVGIESHR